MTASASGRVPFTRSSRRGQDPGVPDEQSPGRGRHHVAGPAADGEGGLVHQGHPPLEVPVEATLPAKFHGSLTTATLPDDGVLLNHLVGRGAGAGATEPGDCHYGRSANRRTAVRLPGVAPLLEIEHLHVAVDGTEILRGVDLAVGEGELHALMGPNGSGKSTLAGTLLGSPAYQVTEGAIRFRGEDVTTWPTDMRAKAGMFLAFQYPEEIPGVPVTQFLRQALSGRVGEDRSVLEVRMAMLRVDEAPRDGQVLRAATSTRASPGVRRNATRSCRWPCSIPRSPSWTRPTRASTSTPCASWPTACRPYGPAAPRSGAARHPLHPHPRALATRRGACAGRREDRGPGRPRAGRPPRGRRVRAVADVSVTHRSGLRGRPHLRKDSPRIRKADFPVLGRAVHGQGRLPGLRRVVPAPPVRPRRHGRLLLDHIRQRAPWGVRPGRGVRPALPKPGRRWAGSSGRPTPSTR